MELKKKITFFFEKENHYVQIYRKTSTNHVSKYTGLVPLDLTWWVGDLFQRWVLAAIELPSLKLTYAYSHEKMGGGFTLLGKNEALLTSKFFRWGWFNHQLEKNRTSQRRKESN